MAIGTFGRGRCRIGPLGWLLRGAAAGAAGTTALNAVTYLDMVVRGRAGSSTPERSVETLAEKAHLEIPGDGEKREHRVTALGALTGLVAGVGVGTLAGLARVAGFRPSVPVGTAVTAGAVLVANNGPMTVLGITDPRSWSASDWLSDVLPHLAYALVVQATLDAFDRP